METRWTSIEAYLTILPDLDGLRKQVLHWLIMYWNTHRRDPTARELAAWVNLRGFDQSADLIRKVGRRLPELADKLNVVHRATERTCADTGRMATTWALGPEPGTKVGRPPKKLPDREYRSLMDRYDLLMQHGD